MQRHDVALSRFVEQNNHTRGGTGLASHLGNLPGYGIEMAPYPVAPKATVRPPRVETRYFQGQCYRVVRWKRPQIGLEREMRAVALPPGRHGVEHGIVGVHLWQQRQSGRCGLRGQMRDDRLGYLHAACTENLAIPGAGHDDAMHTVKDTRPVLLQAIQLPDGHDHAHFAGMFHTPARHRLRRGMHDEQVVIEQTVRHPPNSGSGYGRPAKGSHLLTRS